MKWKVKARVQWKDRIDLSFDCKWLFLMAAMWLIWRLAIKVGDPLVERIAYWLWVVPLALYAIGLVFGIVLLLLALFSSKQG